jgi:hypothetical protein
MVITRIVLVLAVLLMAFLVEIAPCLGQTAQATGQQESAASSVNSQLELVLHDRPQLQPIVQKGSPLCNWLQAAFANTSEGIQIFWDNRPTHASDPASAESTFPDGKKAAYIRVDGIYKSGTSIGLERSPEEVLSNLVFELNNDKHWVENQGISQRAEAGTISRQDYIRSCAKTEYTAGRETADVYTTIWVPFCQSKGLSFTPQLWHMPYPATFEEWLSMYPPGFWYPWKFYGDRYDWITAQREGDTKFNQGDLDGAILDYTKALELGPRSYGSRGLAEMAKGDWDQALADILQCSDLSLSDPQTEDSNQLLIWLVNVQKGKKKDADKELTDYFAKRPASVQNDWAAKISEFLLDQLNEGDFLASSSSPDVKQDQARHCEAWYYAGMKQLLAKDKVRAAQYFHNCLATNQTKFFEYALAREELKALGQTK